MRFSNWFQRLRQVIRNERDARTGVTGKSKRGRGVGGEPGAVSSRPPSQARPHGVPPQYIRDRSPWKPLCCCGVFVEVLLHHLRPRSLPSAAV